MFYFLIVAVLFLVFFIPAKKYVYPWIVSSFFGKPTKREVMKEKLEERTEDLKDLNKMTQQAKSVEGLAKDEKKMEEKVKNVLN